MAGSEQPISIVSADRVNDGLLVRFSDNTTTLFQAHFLYEARDRNGNMPISDDEELSESNNRIP
jgi:hypothetical protein